MKSARLKGGGFNLKDGNKAMVDKQDYGSTGVSPALGKEDGAPSGMTLCWKWPGGEQVNGY